MAPMLVQVCESPFQRSRNGLPLRRAVSSARDVFSIAVPTGAEPPFTTATTRNPSPCGRASTASSESSICWPGVNVRPLKQIWHAIAGIAAATNNAPSTASGRAIVRGHQDAIRGFGRTSGLPTIGTGGGPSERSLLRPPQVADIYGRRDDLVVGVTELVAARAIVF